LVEDPPLTKDPDTDNHEDRPGEESMATLEYVPLNPPILATMFPTPSYDAKYDRTCVIFIGLFPLNAVVTALEGRVTAVWIQPSSVLNEVKVVPPPDTDVAMC
jgi:hypothetical protein